MKGRTVSRTVHPDPVPLLCGHQAPVTHTKGDRVVRCPVCGAESVVTVETVVSFRYTVTEKPATLFPEG